MGKYFKTSTFHNTTSRLEYYYNYKKFNNNDNKNKKHEYQVCFEFYLEVICFIYFYPDESSFVRVRRKIGGVVRGLG